MTYDQQLQHAESCAFTLTHTAGRQAVDTTGDLFCGPTVADYQQAASQKPPGRQQQDHTIDLFT